MVTRSTRGAGLLAGAAAVLLVGSTVAAEPEAAVLGASLEAWNAAFGQPEENPAGPMYGGRFIVRPADGKVWMVEVRYPKGTSATLDEARRQSKAFLPKDAKKVKTYTPPGRPEATVERRCISTTTLGTAAGATETSVGLTDRRKFHASRAIGGRAGYKVMPASPTLTRASG